MIFIESYFYINETFIKVDDFSGTLPDDYAYVNGALILSVNDKPVLTFLDYDYIVLIWGILMTKLIHNNLKEKMIFSFPDHSSDLIFIPIGKNQIRIFLNEDEMAIADRTELLEALVKESRKFFNKLIEIYPDKKEKFTQDLKTFEKIQI